MRSPTCSLALVTANEHDRHERHGFGSTKEARPRLQDTRFIQSRKRTPKTRLGNRKQSGIHPPHSGLSRKLYLTRLVDLGIYQHQGAKHRCMITTIYVIPHPCTLQKRHDSFLYPCIHEHILPNEQCKDPSILKGMM